MAETKGKRIEYCCCCGKDWNVSLTAHIPAQYICPRCEQAMRSRNRNGKRH